MKNTLRHNFSLKETFGNDSLVTTVSTSTGLLSSKSKNLEDTCIRVKYQKDLKEIVNEQKYEWFLLKSATKLTTYI